MFEAPGTVPDVVLVVLVMEEVVRQYYHNIAKQYCSDSVLTAAKAAVLAVSTYCNILP